MQAPYKFSIIAGPLLYAPTFAGLMSAPVMRQLTA